MNRDCLRHGHDPQSVVTSNPAGLVGSYITKCNRCGDLYEVPLPPPDAKPDLRLVR